MKKTGVLYIVSTPIGNLEDITKRAARVLGEVDLIAAEDTRAARNLLNHLEIKKPVTSLFEHNEEGKIGGVLKRIENGGDVALISEAGTPTISDPGFKMVRQARRAGIKVVPVPGASAAMAAITASGLPTDRFTFAGFLPDKPGKRRRALGELGGLGHTLIIYVSKYKLSAVLKDMLEVLGDRQLVMCRELTKMHEEITDSNVSRLLDYVSGREIKGEITLVVSGT